MQTIDPTGESATVGGIYRLPIEVLIQIFSHLSFDGLVCASYVCRRWRSIIKSDITLWKRHRVVLTNVVDIREVLFTVHAMPPLETLSLTFAQSSTANIAWPEVTVTIPDTWERGRARINAKHFVVEYSSKKDIYSVLSWVQLKSLERLHLESMSSRFFAGEGFSALVDNVLRTRDNLQLNPLNRERNFKSLFAYHDNVKSVSYAPLRGESWNTSLEAALAFTHREASYDLEDAGGIRSSPQLAPCPNLERVVVSCEMDRIDLEMLCRLGPMRMLRLEKCTVASLSFLPHCASRLEELVIGDCGTLQEKELRHLSCLQRLRVLQLWKCPFMVQIHTRSLPYLESVDV